MIQLRITEETEDSFKIMKEFLDILHEKEEKAELESIHAWQKGDKRILSISFSVGILLGWIITHLLCQIG